MFMWAPRPTVRKTPYLFFLTIFSHYIVLQDLQRLERATRTEFIIEDVEFRGWVIAAVAALRDVRTGVVKTGITDGPSDGGREGVRRTPKVRPDATNARIEKLIIPLIPNAEVISRRVR